ncbi:MAG: acyl-CoA dehydrogenase family protein [Aeromicrobium sp.]
MMFSADLKSIVDDFFARYEGESDSSSVWSSAVDMDWMEIGVHESLGGAGGTVADLAEIAAGVGRHAIPLPIWQTALAFSVLATAGLPVERALGGAIVIDEPDLVQVDSESGPWKVSLAVKEVGIPEHVATVVIIGEHGGTGWVGVIDRAQLPAAHGQSLAGDPLHDLALDGVVVDADSAAAVPPECFDELRIRTMLLQAATIAGGVSRICDLAREHVQTREQFGRPLIALQAVAHRLADMVIQRDLLEAVLQEALIRPARETASAALVVAVQTADIVAREAHMLHGAMGVTEEHVLRRFTTRLWEAAIEVRCARAQAETLGAAVRAGAGDTALWDISTPGPHAETSADEAPHQLAIPLAEAPR